MDANKVSRRSTIKGISVAGSAAMLGAVTGPWVKTGNAAPKDFRKQLSALVTDPP